MIRNSGLQCGRRKHLVRWIQVPVVERDAEAHGVIRAVQVPRVHSDADGAVLSRILPSRGYRWHAVIEGDLASLWIERNLNPNRVPPFLVFAFEVLMVFARGTKRRQCVALGQAYVPIAIGKSNDQLASAAPRQVKRLKFDERLIREIGLRQATANGQQGPEEGPTSGCAKGRRGKFHRFAWLQS